MHRRTDRVRRNEQHAEPSRAPRSIGCEAIAKVSAQRPQEGFGIGDPRQPSRFSPRPHGLRQLRECAPQRPKIRTALHVPEKHRQQRSRPREREMRKQARPFVDVLPAEQQEVLLQHPLDEFRREFFSDGSRGARGTLCSAAGTTPSTRASTPCIPSRCLPDRTARAHDRTRPARGTCAGRKRRIRRRRRSRDTDPVIAASIPMPHAQATVLPPALASGRSLRAAFAGSLKKIWQETAKTSGSRNPSSRGARNPWSTRMSLFSSDHDVVLRRAKAGVRSTTEAEVLRKQQHPYEGNTLRQTPRCRPSSRCPLR